MTELKIPELAESIRTGTIVNWLVTIGDRIVSGDPVLELETDKINIEIPATTSGVLSSIKKEAGEEVAVGDVVAVISATELKEPTQPKNAFEKVNSGIRHTGELKRAEEYIIASPAARKKARTLGIDLKEIPINNPMGRISAIDVDSYNKSRVLEENEDRDKNVSVEQIAENVTHQERAIERIKMSPRRQTIAKRLLEAQQQAAMLTTFNEVDLSVVMDIRKKRKDTFIKKHGVKLGLMSFFTKAVVLALKEYPYLNAELQNSEILLKKFYDIGIAVSTDEGLVVPVLREADKKSFAGIETEINRLGEKAKTRKLELDDLQGGTFTITNGGVFGSLFSTPILNAPQVGILGMHTIQKRPVVLEDDTIAVRPMMYIALSYDHRIIDGKEAVQFLARVKKIIEDPYDLLLDI